MGPRRLSWLVVLLCVVGVRPSAFGLEKLTDAQRTTVHAALLKSDSFKARLSAALLLGRRGTAEHDLNVLGRALFQDRQHTVRGAAAMAIGTLGSATGIEPILGALADRDPFVRRAARASLVKLATPQSIPYLKLAREREDASVRMAVVEVLGGMAGPTAQQAVGEFLGDQDEAIASTVEAAFRGWDVETAVSVLIASLTHPSYRVRRHAASLASSYPDPRLLPPLADRLSAALEEDGVRKAAIATLRSYAGLIDVADQIKRVQGLVDRSQRVRALVLLGFGEGPRRLEILGRASTDKDAHVRFVAAQSLGRTGDPAAIPVLRAMLEAPENKRLGGAIKAALGALKGITMSP